MVRRPGPLHLALSGVAAIALMVGFSGVASAHADLVSQSPEVDAALVVAPTQVQLRFTEPLLDVGAVVMIVDADSNNWSDGPPSLSGSNLVQAVRSGMPVGNYQVRWRVVSADGHPLSKSFDFTLGAAEGAPEVPSVVAMAEPAQAVDDLAGANSGDFDLSGALEREDGVPPRNWLRTSAIAGITAAAAVAVWLLVVLGTRRSPGAAVPNPQDPSPRGSRFSGISLRASGTPHDQENPLE